MKFEMLTDDAKYGQVPQLRNPEDDKEIGLCKFTYRRMTRHIIVYLLEVSDCSLLFLEGLHWVQHLELRWRWRGNGDGKVNVPENCGAFVA